MVYFCMLTLAARFIDTRIGFTWCSRYLDDWMLILGERRNLIMQLMRGLDRH